MWHSGTWLSYGHGSVRLMVRLDNLKGLFQFEYSYDSIGFASKDRLELHGTEYLEILLQSS